MKIRGKNVVVTGGAGFIGSHVVDALIKEKPSEIIVIDNLFLGSLENLKEARKIFPVKFYKIDVANYSSLKKIFNKHKVNIVFNMAVVPLPTSLVKPKYTIDKNVLMTSNICELQREGKFDLLIQYSSSEVYGTAKYEPMDENHPLIPLTPYAASKAATDHIALSYYHTFGCDVRLIRPFNNYGPRQNSGSYAGVLPITAKRLLNGQKPILHGDGKQARDFIYVEDTAKWTVEVAKNDKTKGMTLNLASGRATQIGILIKGICKELNYRGQIIREKERPGDVRKHIAGVSLAKKVLGFKQSTDLKNGLKKTINWYKDFLKNEKK